MKYIKNIALGILVCIITNNTYPMQETNNVRRIFAIVPAVIAGAVCAKLLCDYFFADTDLVGACREGNLERVKAILENVEDINTFRYTYHFKSGMLNNVAYIETGSPIYYACRYGKLDILQWMVEEKGADVNKMYEERLESPGSGLGIVDPPFTQVIKKTPLYVACWNRNPEIIRYLIEKGADVNAIGRCNPLHYKVGETPLYIACKSGNLEIIKLLLDNGAYIESENHIGGSQYEKPLHVAVIKGQNEVVRELLQRGAAADIRNSKGGTPAHFYYSNLRGDFDYNAITNLRILLEHNPDILHMIDDEGNTPLHMAARFRLYRIVDFFVSQGADVNARNDKGETPLLLACQWPSSNFNLSTGESTVSYLVEHGADINAETNEGKTALYFACMSDRRGWYRFCRLYTWHMGLVKCLIQLGATVKDEYADGGIRRPGDLILHESIITLLNTKIEKRKELEEAMRRFMENDEQSRDKVIQQVKSLITDPEVPTCAIINAVNTLHEHHPDMLQTIDVEGNSLLHKSISSRQYYLTKYLIEEYNADVNARNHQGETPLMTACQLPWRYETRKKDENVVKYLLSKGADIDAKDNNDNTALSMVCADFRHKIDYIYILVARGAEIQDNLDNLDDNRRRRNRTVKSIFKNYKENKKELEGSIQKLLEGEEQEKLKEKEKIINLFIYEEWLPERTKKELLPQLFEAHKKNGDLFSEQDLERCIKKISFDKKFVEEEAFKEALEFAKEKKIKDINGKVL